MYLDATQLMDFDLHLRLIFRRMLMKFFCRVESKARLRHKKGQSVEVRTKTVVSHHRPTTERQGAEAGGSGRGRSRRRRSQARCRAGLAALKAQNVCWCHLLLLVLFRKPDEDTMRCDIATRHYRQLFGHPVKCKLHQWCHTGAIEYQKIGMQFLKSFFEKISRKCHELRFRF